MTYIDPHGKALGHLGRLHGWQQGEKPAPVSLEVDLSNACSLACHGCHMAHTHTKGPWAAKAIQPDGYEHTGTFADETTTLRWMAEAKAAGVQAIVWTGGGEPTLHPHWQAFVAHGHGLGYQQGMYTLGGHIDAKAGDLLADTMTWVVVSLDCVDASTYALEKGVPPARFNAACQGIKHIASRKAVVGVSFLLHAGNWQQTHRMLTLSRWLGADYATFRPTIDVDQAHPSILLGGRSWVAEALPVLEALAQQPDVECDPARFAEWAGWQGHGYSTCYGVRLNATITPDSRMWLCVNRRGVTGSCLGDLKAESFGDIWARHPGHYTVDKGCRAMCRLNPINQTLAAVYAERKHEAFI